MSDEKTATALLKERGGIEKLAFEWADRWKAAHGGDPKVLDIVRPIRFEDNGDDRLPGGAGTYEGGKRR